MQFRESGLTLEEIGIEDPRLRSPRTPDDWDGLMSLVPELQQRLKKTVNRTTGSCRVAAVKRTESGTPEGIGGVSVALLHSWLTEWEQNNEQPPAAWTPFRVSFFVKNLETIKGQTKDFEPWS